MSPKPFCFNKSKVKAFVLGADPTNFSKDKKRVDLLFAFGIGQNPNYFRTILQNLNEIGLHLEDVYIQNLLPEYQKQETNDNLDFLIKAGENAILIAREFNKIDTSKRLPVFLTAEDIYKAIMNESDDKFKPKKLYNLETEIPIPAHKNKLGRVLIPFFRHEHYKLEFWADYQKEIQDYLKSVN